MSKSRESYDARRRDIARAYRRAVRHGNGLDAGWLVTLTVARAAR